MGKDKMQAKDIQRGGYASGMKAGVFGVFSNVLLFAAKLTVGILVRSITVVADALNNLSDGASSVVTVVGYKISSRPADKGHPFGHARFEYVAALVIAVIMMMIGALFLKESLTAIFSPHELQAVGAYVYVILAFSALVKGGQATVYAVTYRKTRSLPMKAAAADSVWDVATTLVALLSTLLFDLAGLNADGYFGAVISVFILVSAIKVLKESVDPLLGDAPLESTVQGLRERVLAYAGVLGVHDIVVHSYGAAHVYAILHVEVPADMTLSDAHDLIDRIEREVSAEMGLTLVAHVDPQSEGLAAAADLKEELRAFLSEKADLLSLHDFRLRKEEEKLCLYFDAEVPWESEVTAESVTALLKREFNGEYEYFVTVDKR